MDQEAASSIASLIFCGQAGDNPATYIEQISYLIYLSCWMKRKLTESCRQPGESMRETVLLFPQQSATVWSKWRFKSGPELRDFRDEVFLHGFTGER